MVRLIDRHQTVRNVCHSFYRVFFLVQPTVKNLTRNIYYKVRQRKAADSRINMPGIITLAWKTIMTDKVSVDSPVDKWTRSSTGVKNQLCGHLSHHIAGFVVHQLYVCVS